MRSKKHLLVTPMALLDEVVGACPELIQIYKHVREHGINGLPSHCIYPLCLTANVLERKQSPMMMQSVEQIVAMASKIGIYGAIMAWSQERIIYDFDLDLLHELEGNAKVPTEVLERLPYACPYIALPDGYTDFDGFFVLNDWDELTQKTELRILPIKDGEPHNLPLYVPYERGQYLSVDNVKASARETLGEPQEQIESEMAELVWRDVSPFLPAILYICSEGADVVERQGTGRKRDPRAIEPKILDAGYQVGSAIRSYRLKYTGDSQSPHGTGSVRPHVRRAHWHHYWTGPRSEPENRKIVLKWLPPTFVSGDDPCPTIRSAK